MEGLIEEAVLGPTSLPSALKAPPQRYRTLRIDPVQTCNIQCLYCEVGRGRERISPEQMHQFFAERVTSVDAVHLGCAMEPTLHRELGKLLLTARNVGNPTSLLAIQTNGTLLHRHDFAPFAEADLNQVSVSIDTIDPSLTRVLRDGTDVHQVLDNVDRLRQALKNPVLVFSTTVTSLNLHAIEPLVQFAVEFGVHWISLREVFLTDPTPENESLLLEPGAFGELEARLAPYAPLIDIRLTPADALLAVNTRCQRTLEQVLNA